MPRYFIEVRYKGTQFSGFQIQDKGVTIQGEINRALQILLKTEIITVTSSRTDAGVHASQNFLHIDLQQPFNPKLLYNLNALLPADIVVVGIYPVNEHSHSRFDAMARDYVYHIIYHKDPFRREFSYFYPFPLDLELLQKASQILCETSDFTSLSKRHTDTHTNICRLHYAKWVEQDQMLTFNVSANRFLRGMVRAMVATQLQVGRGIITLEQFQQILELKDCTKADFGAPAHGLFLDRIHYPEHMLKV
jgi:tRNA pseudouridine38-40 synthase